MNRKYLIGLTVQHKCCGEGVISGFTHSAKDHKKKYIKISYKNQEVRYYLISEGILPSLEFVDNKKIDEKFRQVYFLTKEGTVMEFDSITDKHYSCNFCGANVLYSKEAQINALKNGDEPPVLCGACNKKAKKIRENEIKKREISALMHQPYPKKRVQKPHDTDGMHI